MEKQKWSIGNTTHLTEKDKIKKTKVGPFQIAALCGDDDLVYEIVCAQDAVYYKQKLTERQKFLLGY